MFNRLVCAILIVLAAFSLSVPVRAENGNIAAGVVGGLIGGALIGGAIASRPPPPAYYVPAPVYIEDPPPCRWARERFWDGYGWQYRRVQVCD